MQLLPARQRAVRATRRPRLVRARDGRGARALDRGRQQRPTTRPRAAPRRSLASTTSTAEAAVVDAFLSAWADVDIPRIIALLSDNVLLTPTGLRFEGAAAVGEFFATQPMDGRLDRITRANAQPTLASYAGHEAYGVTVFALRGDRIAGITGFPHDLEVFTQLDLPARSTG